MDYEKKYKEALNKAKELMTTSVAFDRFTIEHIFPELKESEDKIYKRAIRQMYSFLPNKPTYIGDVRVEDIFAWLEKKGKQKPTDKVEPKFKAGDWIVRELDNSVHQVKAVIENISNGKYGYDLTKGGYISSQDANFYHLWTIQEAKDGDVLDCEGCEYLLFKSFSNTDGRLKLYCWYNVQTNNFHGRGTDSKLRQEANIHPATKEQRDLLFQKMKEAGYEYDAEKKQLRKMEYVKSKFQILKDTWYVCTCTTCTEDSRIWFNNGTAYLGSEILKYDLGFEPEEYQNYFRLWTIKDAKDGDILASKSGDKIFSYRGSLNLRGNPCAYYGIYKVHDGICFSPCAIGNSFTCEEVFPATKEQRKTLFEERTAAKGVLHFNKKELKKIKDETSIAVNNPDAYKIVFADGEAHAKEEQWKPSDEQMDALQYIYRNLNPPLTNKLGWDSLKTLELLYQDLKKL